MGDGWTDSWQRQLINFFVYCPRGISFIKSPDALDLVTDGQILCNLFSEIAEMVCPSNVVHMVTNNGSNYKASGRLLCEKYPSISWSPCATHYINLILKDIGEMLHVMDLVNWESKVSVFAYNRKWCLNWLRKRLGWTDLIWSGLTRLAITFIALKSLHDHKHDLQALVTCELFKKLWLSRSDKAKEVTKIILDEKFWNDFLMVIKIAGPLICLLHLVDSTETCFGLWLWGHVQST